MSKILFEEHSGLSNMDYTMQPFVGKPVTAETRSCKASFVSRIKVPIK